MPVRFRKTKKIAPGLTLNLGKRGPSLSIGPRGSKTTLGPSGTRHTVGIPGTGISYTTKLNAKKKSGCGTKSIILLLALITFSLLISNL